MFHTRYASHCLAVLLSSWILLLTGLGNATVVAQQYLPVWFENFDAGEQTVDWVFEPTPDGIPGLTYTGPGNTAVNENCHNYWIINNAHTPDSTTTPPGLGQRARCAGSSSEYLYPNPFKGADNRSLHITYPACGRVGPAGLGIETELPDSGDAYSWYDGPNHDGSESHASASDQIAYMNAGFSTVGLCNLKLFFEAYLGGDEAQDLTDRSLLYSLDGGTSWQVLQADLDYVHLHEFVIGPGACRHWMVYELDLPADLENQPDVRFGFRWRNDNPQDLAENQRSLHSAFNVDNIKVVAQSADWQIEIQASDETQWCKGADFQLAAVFTESAPIPVGGPVPTFAYNWTITPNTFNWMGGTSDTDQYPIAQFTANGTYTVELTVEQTDGNPTCANLQTVQLTIDVQDCPPAADFDVSVPVVCATNPAPTPGSNTVVRLLDRSESIPPLTAWNWSVVPPTVSYVNSTDATSQEPELTFDAPGTYEITLTATNPDGSDTRTYTAIVEAIDCECASAGGSGQVEEVLFETFNNIPANTFPAGWTTPMNTDDNRWVVNAIYQSGGFIGERVQNQPGGIQGGPRSQYAHIYSNSVCNSFFNVCQAEYDAGQASESDLVTPSLNTTGLQDVSFSFWWLSVGQPNRDFGQVYYRTDGQNWQLLPGLPNRLQSNANWRQETIQNPAFDDQADLQFRFYWENDGAGGSGPAFAIDDVLVEGERPAAPTEGIFVCPVSSPICAGATIDINFRAFGTYNPGNEFTVEIDSDPAFPNPEVLGTFPLDGTDLDEVVSITIPDDLPLGSTYRIRVVSSDPVATPITDNGSDLEIITVPDAVAITGDTAVCAGTPGVVYTAPPLEPGQTARWELTGGGTGTATNPTTFTVDWEETTGRDSVLYFLENTCGSADTSLLRVTRVGRDTITPLTGDQIRCVGENGVYAVDSLPGATYAWTMTGGTYDNPPADSAREAITWNQPGTHLLKVVQTDACGFRDSSEARITVLDAPQVPTITGPVTLCAGTQAQYSIGAQPGTSVSWSVTGDLTIDQTDGRLVTLTAGASGSGTLEVEVSSPGCGTESASLDITITDTYTLDGIAGATAICTGTGTTEVYSVPFYEEATYTWTITGGNAAGPTDQAALRADWDDAAPERRLKVVVETPCGIDSAEITVDFIAAPTGEILGHLELCDLGTDQQGKYNTPAILGATYQWTATGGQITSSDQTADITVLWQAAAPVWELELEVASPCGANNNTQIITRIPVPNPAVTGPTDVCPGVVYTYTVTAVPTSDYTWNVTDGTIQQGQGTETVEVVWDAGGTPTISVDISGNCINDTYDLAGPFNLSDLNLTNCAASPSPANINQAVTVSGEIQGGTGPYTVRLDFGDGNTQTLNGFAGPAIAEPHPYTAAGNYTITIEVEDANGCIVSCSDAQVTVQAATITVDGTDPDLGPVIFCSTETAPQNITVPFTTGGPFGAANTFALEWADNDQFTNAVILNCPPPNDASPITCSIPFPQPPGTYYLRVVSTDPTVQSNPVTVQVNAPPVIDLQLQPNDTLCLKDSLDVEPQSATPGINYLQATWDLGDGNTQTNETEITDYVYADSGRYVISLSGTHAGCDYISTSDTVTVLPLPEVEIDLRATNPVAGASEEALLLPVSDEAAFSYAGPGGISLYAWTWQVDDRPEADTASGPALNRVLQRYTEEGSYEIELRVTDTLGCSNTATRSLLVDQIKNLIIPTVFTPNGDGINDLYEIQGPVRTGNLTILNRWGGIVYQTSTLPLRWDGQEDNSEIQPGTYFYQLEVELIDGRRVERYGSMTLLR